MAALHCGFCGYDFDPACQPEGCTACPLKPACGHLTCPRCGYPVLPEAKLVSLVRRLFTRHESTPKEHA